MLATWVSTVNLLFTLCAYSAAAKEIKTESVVFVNPPAWVSEAMVEKATSPIHTYLQWEVRRVKVSYHSDAAEFESIHNGGPAVAAFFRRKDSTVHLGPRVTAGNFHAVFGHEWVHVVFFQKYKGAIPQWLEEGLANYLAKLGSVDYAWLATQPFQDVRELHHPLSDVSTMKFHYQTSTAVTEMIASRCALPDLLQLSVKKKLETYLSTFCEIANINGAYKEWVAKHQKSGPPHKYKPPPPLRGSASGSPRKKPSGL